MVTKKIVIPTTRALAEHAAEVTAVLREEEPPLGLAHNEAICPACSLAFLVAGDPGSNWGICPDCFGAALQTVPKD